MSSRLYLPAPSRVKCPSQCRGAAKCCYRETGRGRKTACGRRRKRQTKMVEERGEENKEKEDREGGEKSLTNTLEPLSIMGFHSRIS